MGGVWAIIISRVLILIIVESICQVSSSVELACPNESGWILHYDTQKCFKLDNIGHVANASFKLWRQHRELCTQRGARFDLYKPRSQSQDDFVNRHTYERNKNNDILLGFQTCGRLNDAWCYIGEENKPLQWYKTGGHIKANPAAGGTSPNCGVWKHGKRSSFWYNPSCTTSYIGKKTSRLCEFDAINYLHNITAALRRGNSSELKTALNFYALTSKIGAVSDSESKLYLEKMQYEYNQSNYTMGLTSFMKIMRESSVQFVNEALRNDWSTLDVFLNKPILSLNVNFDDNDEKKLFLLSVKTLYQHCRSGWVQSADLKKTARNVHRTLFVHAVDAKNKSKSYTMLQKLGVKHELNLWIEYSRALNHANFNEVEESIQTLNDALASNDGPTLMNILAINGIVDARIDTRQEGVIDSRTGLNDTYGQEWVNIIKQAGLVLQGNLTLSNVHLVVQAKVLMLLKDSVRNQNITEFLDALYHPSLRLEIPFDWDAVSCMPFFRDIMADFTLLNVKAFIRENKRSGCIQKTTLMPLNSYSVGIQKTTLMPLNSYSVGIQKTTLMPLNNDPVGIDLCVSQPCKNDAVCTDIGTGIRCTCTEGYVGKTCSHRSPQNILAHIPDLGAQLKQQRKAKVYNNVAAKARDLAKSNLNLWFILLVAFTIDVTVCILLRAKRRINKKLRIKNRDRRALQRTTQYKGKLLFDSSRFKKRSHNSRHTTGSMGQNSTPQRDLTPVMKNTTTSIAERVSDSHTSGYSPTPESTHVPPLVTTSKIQPYITEEKKQKTKKKKKKGQKEKEKEETEKKEKKEKTEEKNRSKKTHPTREKKKEENDEKRGEKDNINRTKNPQPTRGKKKKGEKEKEMKENELKVKKEKKEEINHTQKVKPMREKKKEEKKKKEMNDKTNLTEIDNQKKKNNKKTNNNKKRETINSARGDRNNPDNLYSSSGSNLETEKIYVNEITEIFKKASSKNLLTQKVSGYDRISSVSSFSGISDLGTRISSFGGFGGKSRWLSIVTKQRDVDKQLKKIDSEQFEQTDLEN